MGVRLEANFTIFLLFFGIAAMEALQCGSWLRSSFWAAIGIVFLLADSFKAKRPV